LSGISEEKKKKKKRRDVMLGIKMRIFKVEHALSSPIFLLVITCRAEERALTFSYL
jgi:hypothetical protein